MRKISTLIILLTSCFLIACTTEEEPAIKSETNNPIPFVNIKYLALGDSYTIGQSVCETCRFPAQLKDSIKKNLTVGTDLSLKLIARTGWTTTNLIAAINEENLTEDYDLVTLLIGVNNQYQGKSFSTYEKEFPELVNKSIALAKGKKTNVIVVSIPDYAFTPYGHGSPSISNELYKYNTFAQNYCQENNIEFVYITDITREGLSNPKLVASDGLHPSELAYTKFVERILPKAKVALSD